MAMGMAGSRRRGRGSRRAPMAEINVTPLVDVMLVLLIIFMVTAPLLTSGVTLISAIAARRRPRPRRPPDPPARPIAMR